MLVRTPQPGEQLRKFKLLTRLEYYLKGLQPLSQSALFVALRNRIEAIFAVSDYERLDRIGLMGATGRPFRFSGPFFRNKSVIRASRGRAVGRVFHLMGREFMFVGFDTDVYGLVARQRFREILEYKSKLASAESTIQRMEAWLEQRDFADEDPVRLGAEWVEDKKRFRLQLEGPVMFTQSGRVVGALNPIGDRKTPSEPLSPEERSKDGIGWQLTQGGSLSSTDVRPLPVRIRS
jgi:hypothetical protein